ncbi:histidinol-phosphate transaminase [Novosphingobium sp. TCA1]|uniref:Histidinol-phosphate aminotransferase n=1 Tax=Novosphingobium pentaromativorans TaxID=205844 RepID=A0A2W5NI43_9SPHN|nr:histidinol-phosphate transaminase [Novosphingobium sp. TCA1]PZQ51899.1 MAG: histidinol-phosphate transaminase [Novosphingobium pentaromativorans]GFE73319.1 histidinol-phosphate aminotransferase [Novosphingobium sp. TCA1]
MTDSQTLRPTAASHGGPTPKPWIEAIHAYVPGKSKGKDGKPLIKLSANENPLGTSRAALDARAQAPALYPDPDSTALRAAIAQKHGLDAARVVMGTGSDELLNLAAQGYAGPGDEVIYVRYGFSVYDIAARRCGATPVIAPDADYGTDVDALLALVTDRTRVVFVANPNNPTGSYLPGGEIARLHAGLPSDVLLVLDQAYGEYVAPEDDDGAMALAQAHANVLVTRTFSKIFGLAGERIGWATGAPGIVATLNRIRGPFNVSATGQAMALAALGDADFVEASRIHNRDERARFVKALEALGNHGLRPLPTQANFVLVLFEGALTAEAAFEGLAERGYIVRWLPGQGLPQALRFTIGKPEDMDAIAAALRDMAEAAQ